MPIVSVVMPVYNGQEHLPETLECLRAEACQVDLELISVDDGSDDTSLDILQDSGLPGQVLRQSRKGPAAARNLGIGQARGEFVAFLDADDLWPEGSLALRCLTLRTEEHLAVCQGLVKTFATGPVPPRLTSRLRQQPFRAVNLGSALFRRSLLQTLGGFDESLTFDEDTDLWIRLWEAGVSKGWLEETCLLYRLHAQSMTRHAPEDARALLPLLKRHKDRMSGQPVRSQVSLSAYLGW